MKPEKIKKDNNGQLISDTPNSEHPVSEKHTTVFPLSFIRQLNAKEKTAKFVSIVEDEMDFFA